MTVAIRVWTCVSVWRLQQEGNTIYHFIHRLEKPLGAECKDAGQSALSWSCCTINSVGNEILSFEIIR